MNSVRKCCKENVVQRIGIPEKIVQMNRVRQILYRKLLYRKRCTETTAQEKVVHENTGNDVQEML